MKSLFIHIRSSIKLILLVLIASILIIGIFSLFYKVIYSVSLNGEFIGYTSNKAEIQEKINEYMQATDEDNTAFIDIKTLPEYSLCFVKKSLKTNDDEILEKIAGLGTTYYKYYAILEDGTEKYYVATKEQAEDIIKQLTDKKSSNIKKISYNQVFGTEMKDFTETDKIVTALYKKPVVYSGGSSYTMASADVKMDLGISLIKPVASGYTITSRYGARSGGHSGLDIAAKTGTTICAAASGTVSVVKSLTGSYGNYLVINHGNGVQTLYAHCNTILVSQGDTVSQGQAIATVGSTGNSTGPHLHLEIRVNGTTLNPQNYLY